MSMFPSSPPVNRCSMCGEQYWFAHVCRSEPLFQPPAQEPAGCRPLPQLTEEDVRRIVREEFSKLITFSSN